MGGNIWCGWPTVVAVSHTFHIAGNYTAWLLTTYVSYSSFWQITLLDTIV